MKLKTQNIIYILIVGFFFGRKTDQNLIGNYSICKNGKYMEVYFKKDSMRRRQWDSWVKLAEWRRIEMENDTLHLETFGEYRDSLKWKQNILKRT